MMAYICIPDSNTTVDCVGEMLDNNRPTQDKWFAEKTKKNQPNAFIYLFELAWALWVVA